MASPPANPSVAQLDNGLTVVVTPLPHLALTSMILFCRVGSRHEEAADNGLSHLLEHVLFRGCAAYPDTHSLNAAIEGMGTALDAATTPDYTTFEAACLPARLPAMLDIVGAMIREPTFAGVEVEKRIITEELQDEIDASGRDIDPDNLAKMRLFPDTSLGFKVGGTLAGLKRFEAVDCRRWHARHYGAANLVLSVAGPVLPAAVLAQAERAFGALPRGAARRVPAARTRADLPAFEFTRHSGPQCDVLLSWVVPPEPHPDFAALMMAQRLLDDGTCARLRHRVVDQLGLAYHAGADCEVYDGAAIFAVGTQTRPNQAVAVLDAVLEVLDELGREPPPEGELERMKNRLELEIAGLGDAAAQTAFWHGLQELHPESEPLAVRWQKMLAVTAGDLARVVREHLPRNRVQLTVVGELEPLWRASLRHRVRSAG